MCSYNVFLQQFEDISAVALALEVTRYGQMSFLPNLKQYIYRRSFIKKFNCTIWPVTLLQLTVLVSSW